MDPARDATVTGRAASAGRASSLANTPWPLRFACYQRNSSLQIARVSCRPLCTLCCEPRFSIVHYGWAHPGHTRLPNAQRAPQFMMRTVPISREGFPACWSRTECEEYASGGIQWWIRRCLRGRMESPDETSVPAMDFNVP